MMNTKFFPFQIYHKPNMNDIEQEIIDATNDFAMAVTEDNGLDANTRAAKITSLFTKDATLRATVSQIIRTNFSGPGLDIFSYFECYFSRSVIPDLAVLNANYDIVKVRDDLYYNLALYLVHNF